MISITTEPGSLELLLTGELSVRQCLGQFLDAEAFMRLLVLNRAIWRSLTEQPDLLAKLYYQRMLNCDKSMFYDFYYEEKMLQEDRSRTAAACSNVEGGFLQNHRLCGQIHRELNKNLSELLNDDATASAICNRIFHVFKEPDLPLPKLRKDTIGNYCETPLQTHMALMNWQARMPEPIEQPFVYLQKALIERQHQVLEELKVLSAPQLLQLRHRSELVCAYQPTSSAFVNVLKLLAVVTENHLDSLRKLLVTQSDSLYDRFVEFNLRFNCYRYTMIQLEVYYGARMQEQLGFLFEHFNFVFELVLPQYSAEPRACIWRMMAKKWFTAMNHQHAVNMQTYRYLLAKERQGFLRELSLEEDVFTYTNLSCRSQGRCKLMNSTQHSSELYKKELAGLSLSEFFQGADGSCYREVLLRDYREYIVDLSLNQIRVHWCGHTNHSVGKPYMQFEDELLKENCNYFHHLATTLGNVPLLRTVLERQVVFLGDRLKLATLVRFIKQQQKLLDAEKQRYPELEEDCRLQYTLDDYDEQIDYLNQQRQLTKELDPQQRMFYDLTETVTMEVLQQIARDRLDEDSEDGRSVESYVSSEDS